MMNLAFRLIFFANKIKKGWVGNMPLLLDYNGVFDLKITLYFNFKNHFIIREVLTRFRLFKKTSKN
jgi:hypothetical protein